MPACPACGAENRPDARFCDACGAPLAAPAAGEERKVVSVLFVDLVGFTAASEQADPEDVRATLRSYHARVKQEIERFGGTVEKFVGDAVMAVFGAPIAHEDDAERAVRAALRILEAVDELGLSVRGAVNTGEAVVALGARPAEGEGIVTGDVVNTASRLQGAAPVGGVVVGGLTYRATRGVIEYEELEPVELKGKAAPVALWLAKGARSRFGVDVLLEAPTPFVGRGHELSLLKETHGRTIRDRALQLVTVTGEPGVGKTRLVAELSEYLDSLPELVYWRQGRCLPYGEGITFWALGEIVKAQAGILESDTTEQAAAKLAAAIEPVAAESERDWLAARLGPLVGLGETGAAERQESFAAWLRFLEGIAEQRPLVLMIEDLHWADAALLEFLDHLADWTTGVPILLVCTARPELYERNPGWGGGKRNSATISLGPLAPEETARLLAALLEQAVLPAETQSALLERAGGNPLYAEEFVRMLLDQGVLERRGRGLVVNAAAGVIPVPESVQALIAARLDTLAPERKALLYDAAVVGKVFWAGAVEAMGERAAGAVEEGLRELVRKELVRPARRSSVEGQAELAFWHATIRDVAYGQIPRESRARKHAAAAAWIERIAGERVGDQAELLAHHYEEALRLARAAGDDTLATELEEPAIRFLLEAAERARNLDPRAGAAYYERAAELAPRDDLRRARALRESTGLLTRSGELRFEEAWDRSHEALRIAETAGDAVEIGATLAGIAIGLYIAGRTSESRDHLERAAGFLESAGPSKELGQVLSHLAFNEMVDGAVERGLELAERALEVLALAEAHGEGRLLALQVRGGCRCDLGDLGGVEDLRQACDEALETGMALSVTIMHINLGDWLWVTAGPAAGLETHRVGIDYAERRGLPATWARAETTWFLYELGEWDELLAVADRVLEESSELGAVSQPMLMVQAMTAQVRAWRGQPADGGAEGELLAAARTASDPQVYAPALGAAALRRGRQGDAPGVIEVVEEYEQLQRAGVIPFHGCGLPEIVRAALAVGEVERAERIVAAAKPVLLRDDNVLLSAQAALAEAKGETAEALELHRSAAERWREFGHVLEEALSLAGAARCGDATGAAGAAAIFDRLGVAEQQRPAAATG